MVLTFNRKMMTEIPGEGGSPGPIEDVDMVYENADIEQEIINGFTGHVSKSVNSLTLNITNFLSDYDGVTREPLYRTSEKESKGTGNLATGKPRYYPAAYIEAMKETATQEEPDEPVDPPTDPRVNL